MWVTAEGGAMIYRRSGTGLLQILHSPVAFNGMEKSEQILLIIFLRIVSIIPYHPWVENLYKQEEET